MTQIAVIIVNYNTAELTLQGIQTVLDRPVPNADVEIHVVDNASPDGDAKMLSDAVTQNGWDSMVSLHLEDTNHGFGRGNNVVLHKLAARSAPPEFVFFLNPDAQLQSNVLSICLDFMATHPKAALLGARSYNPGDPNPAVAAFRFPSVLGTFGGAVNFGPISRLFEKYSVALPADLPVTKVDWVSGAAVFARFEALKDVGFYDPAYFLYYEEVDMMRAVAMAGWDCWHVPEAEIVHIEGAATDVKSADRSRPRRPGYWYYSWQYYFRKNHGRSGALLAALFWALGSAIDVLVSKLRGKTPASPSYFFRDLWAGVVRPLLGFSSSRH